MPCCTVKGMSEAESSTDSDRRLGGPLREESDSEGCGTDVSDTGGRGAGRVIKRLGVSPEGPKGQMGPDLWWAPNGTLLDTISNPCRGRWVPSPWKPKASGTFLALAWENGGKRRKASKWHGKKGGNGGKQRI